jgi:peptide/histidine transporter 3/4
MALNPDLYMRSFVIIFTLAGYGFVAMIMCCFPLAGILADIRYGRYRTVVGSVFLVLITEPLVALVSVIALSPVLSLDIKYVAFVWSEAFLSIVGFVLFTASYISLVIFTANVIQFGMDQLHDSPGEDRTLFIHWYVWVYYLSILIGQLAWNLALHVPYNMAFNTYYNIIGYCMLGFIPVSALVILPATLCLARCRRQWFLIEPGQYNPYKLVYRITKFARQHKVPVHRSAFTYCEDEVPTGLDLAKEKYGGPFTTEQVEDVKVFYGILKILFSFGTVFFMDFAASSVLPMYALHTTPFYRFR